MTHEGILPNGDAQETAAGKRYTDAQHLAFLRRVCGPHSVESSSQEEQHRRNPILYIEGLPGAGKTTLVAGLATRIPDSIVVPEFDSPIPEAYLEIDPLHTPIDALAEAELWFYSQYERKDNEIRQLPAGRTTIVDRGILGLIPFADSWDESGRISQIIMDYARMHEWAQGHYILLIADMSVIRDRLMRRDKHIDETRWSEIEKVVGALRTNLIEIAQITGSTIIDTSNKTPAQVLDDVMGLYYSIVSSDGL